MNVPRWEAMLPSVDQLARVDASLADRLAGLDAQRRVPLEDALGALGLYLSRRPLNAWCVDETIVHHAVGGSEGQVSGGWFDDATRCGLLIREGGSVRPVDRLTCVRLAARRLAAVGLGPEALSGATCGVRFDVLAIALSSGDGGASAAWIAELPEGPMEALSGATAALRLYGMALGAAVPDGLGAELVDAALAWTSPDGRETHASVSAGALAAVLRSGGRQSSRVSQRLTERHQSILAALAQEMEVGVRELLVESLAWTCEALVTAQRHDRDGLQLLWESTPGHRHLVLEAMGRALPSGDDTDAWLVEMVGRSLSAGEPRVLGALAAVDGFPAEVEDLLMAALVRARTEEDPAVVGRAIEASELIAERSEVSDPLVYALSRLVVSEADPRVRVAASRAIAHHPEAMEAYEAVLRPTVAHLLRHATDPTEQAVAAAASLYLGRDDIMAPAMAVALVADGISPSVLSPALAHGLAYTPELVAGVLQVFVAQERPLRLAATALLEDTVNRALARTKVGEMDPCPGAPPPSVMEPLLRLILPYVGDIADPDLSAGAAYVCAALGHGLPHVAEAIWVARQAAAADEELACALNLALGTAGVPNDQMVNALARDVVDGSMALSAHACVGLAHIGELRSDYEALDDIWRHRLHVQLGADPRLAAPLQALCFALARKPIGPVAGAVRPE